MNKVIKVLMMLLLVGILYCLLDSGHSQPPAGAWQGCGNGNGISLADVYNAGFFHRDSSDTVTGKPVFDDTTWIARVRFEPTGATNYFYMSANDRWTPSELLATSIATVGQITSGANMVCGEYFVGDKIYHASNPIKIMPIDIDDYISFSTTSDVPVMSTVGDCDLKIQSSSGNIIIGDGTDAVCKFIKIGSHCAIVMNTDADTFWLAADTTGF